MSEYDSTNDTIAHIARVESLISEVILNLCKRSARHDLSKLDSPEKEILDEVTPLLKGLTYGSEEYHKQLVTMKAALDHHYANNSHHPQYYETGMKGMSLLDVLEMLLDWKAASERHADGDILRSIFVNKERFGYDDMMMQIFINTAIELKWTNDHKEGEREVDRCVASP